MELSEVEFNWDDLLVGEDEAFATTKTVTITAEFFVDEDGDNAVTVNVGAYGLRKESLLELLGLAAAIVEDKVEDDEDDDS